MAHFHLPFILASILPLTTADYECLCNYHVETAVHSTPSEKSPHIGNLAEFDCKPTYVLTSSIPQWQAVQFEKQVGYIPLDDQTKVQTCPGHPSPDDVVIATTTMKNTVMSLKAISTQALTSLHFNKVSSSSTPSTTRSTTTKQTTKDVTTIPTPTTISTTSATPVVTSSPSTTTIATKISTTVLPSTTTSSARTTHTNTTTISTSKITASTLPSSSSTTPSTTKSTSTSTKTTDTTTKSTPTTTKTTVMTTISTTKTTRTTPTTRTTTTRTTPTTTRTTPDRTTTTKTTPTTTRATHTITKATTTRMLQCPPQVPRSRNLREFGSHCYEFILGVHKKWPDAEQDCNRKGGHLVSIGSQTEQTFVYQSLGVLNFHDDDGVWIGLTDQDHEGRWTWSSGEYNMQFILADANETVEISFRPLAFLSLHHGNYPILGKHGRQRNQATSASNPISLKSDPNH